MTTKITITTILFVLIFTTNSFSQRLINDKYEMYLIDIEESSMNVSKEMKMTSKTQTFYNGIIEVTFLEDGKSKKFNFFFSSWDNQYKEFLIKDEKHQVVLPKIYFNDKETAIIKKGEEEICTKLEDNTTPDSSILSSMAVWLDHQEEK